MNTRTGTLKGRWLLASGLGCALIGLGPEAGIARASDGGTSTANGSISPELLAPRFASGSDAGANAHTNNFSPAAINYDDCISAIDIQFTLDLANAPAGDEIQAWAGSGTADCTQVAARTNASSDTPNQFPGRCWPVAPAGAFDPTASTTTSRLHVRDLVAYIGQNIVPTTYSPTTSLSVCQPFATNSAVTLNVYFLFVPAAGSSGAADGGATTVFPPDGVSGLYSTTAALVGPFAPQSVSVPNDGITATSLVVNWAPQSETIIQGYNIYAQDQGVGGVNTGVVSVDAGATYQETIQCHPRLTCEAGASGDGGEDGGISDASGTADGSTSKDATLPDATLVDSGSSSEACDAGFSMEWEAVDAAAYSGFTDAGLAAAGCEITSPVNAQHPSTSTSSTCVSGVLVPVFQVDGGLGSQAAAAADASVTANGFVTSFDAGVDSGLDSGFDASVVTTTTTTTTTPGTIPETAGISNIPSRYLNTYQPGGSVGSYTLTGLTTSHQYAIAVAAVDSYGNVGPVGTLGCSTPTPVDDFFMMYMNDGGQAGGGCALSAVGVPALGPVFGLGIMGTLVGLSRRRRRARRAP